MNFCDLFEQIEIPVLVCRADTLEVIYGNPSAFLLLSAQESAPQWEVLRPTLAELLPTETAVLELPRRAEGSQTVQLHLPSGELRPLRLVFNAMQLEGAEYIKLCLYPAERAARLPRRSLEILSAVSGNEENAVYVSDVESGEILFANQGFAAILGQTQEEMQGQCVYPYLEQLGRTQAKEPIERLVSPTGEILKRSHSWEFFYQERWYLVRNAIIPWVDGREVHIETGTDITRQKQQEARLEYEASMDMMTGVHNRAWGRRLIENVLSHGQSGNRSTLVFLDLDRLKEVNDRFGHVAGDRMIIETVRLIEGSIRRSDSLFRWGGDEFVMLLRATQEETARVMEKIAARMEERNAESAEPFPLRFSYGVVEIHDGHSYTVDTLIAEADRKMYVEKKRVEELAES